MGTGGVVVLVPFQPTALANNAAVTTDTVIGITWTASANGGTAVLYYSVYFDQGQGTETYVLLSSPVSTTSFTTSTTLIPGTTYKFYVTATNSVGTGAPSSVLSVLAAKVPDAPLGPYNDAAVTTGYQVGLTWSTTNVYNGGSPVIDYAVYYSTSSTGTFTLFQSGITTQASTVTGLSPGVVYYFRVASRNLVGLSAVSSTLSVQATQVPDSPTNLANVPALTNRAQIGLTWTAPTFVGGTPILDYRVWSDQGTGTTYTVLAENVATTSYTATGLT